MKKTLLIILTLFLTINTFAGEKEPGFFPIQLDILNDIKENLKKIRQENLNKNILLYLSIDEEGGYAWYYDSYKKDIKDKDHKKTYKKCVKNSKKYRVGEDCYLFAVNEKIVWDFVKAEAIKKEQAVKNRIIPFIDQEKELTYLNPKDKKPKRSIIDRPDTNDDHQVHFIYAILKNGKDKEWDINGYIEKNVLKVNKNFLKWSAKNKKSNSMGQKFKYDFSKDGKIDVSFARLNLTRKEIDKPDHPNGIIYRELFRQGFNNPKKVYAIFSGFKSKHGNSDGGEGGPLFTILYGPAIKSYGSKDMEIVILHELFHTQGAAYDCGKRTYRGAHVKGSDVLSSGNVSTKIDSKNDTYYRHGIEGCPDLADSVFLKPTSENSWDPYEVFCKKNVGKFKHKKLFSTKDGIDRCKNQRLIDKM
ncbi:hypothetical protein N9W37_01360 [Candidatus Pelagibacter bacterium]|nr:hypothetical protein [Candidatus Pelagibacter bacterium]